MEKSIFDKDLELVKEFGKEEINGKSFEEFLSGEEEYFKIIEPLFAAMLPWKKNYNSNQIKEKLIFYLRRFKSKQRRKEKPKKINKGSIVFFPVSKSRIIFLEPIIKKLSKKEDVFVLRFDYSLNGLKKELEKRGIPYVNFEHYLDKNIVKKAKKIYQNFKKSLKISKEIVKRNRKYSRLIPVLKYFFGNRRRLYEILEFIEVIKNFINKEKPSTFVISNETMDIERAIAYLCERNKIPCYSFQDGNVNLEAPESPEILSSKKIVFGDAAKELLIKKGVPKEKLKVTGSPLYDSFANKKFAPEEVKKIKKNLGLQNKKIILFATTTNLEVAKKRLEVLCKLAKENKNLGIIVKQHPAEYSSKKYGKTYKKIAKKYSVKIIISKDDMWKMLLISDIYTTEFSTTILEALALGKPIILTNFEKFYKYEYYPEFKGIFWHPYNYDDFKEAVEDILKNKPGKKEELFRKKMVKNHLYKLDGKSTERILNIILKVKK